MLKLRDYQGKLVVAVFVSLQQGHKNILCVAPTGSGKTVCFVKIAEEFLRQSDDDTCVLVLSHLSLLTEQTKAKFEKFSNVNVGVLQAQTYPEKDDRVIVSTMQSAREFDKVYQWLDDSNKKVGLIIVDESHRKFNASYNEIFNTFKGTPHVDFTATPFKGKRLVANTYDKVAFSITLQELIEKKYLVPPILNTIEFNSKDSEERVAVVMRLYKEHELGKSAIVFMRTKQECALAADTFTNVGIKAVAVTDDVKGEKRNEIFERYEKGEIQVLISVDVLTAGFDAPICEVVFMFGTENPSTYLQRVGRALRPEDADCVKPHHKKQNARIYCFGDTPTIQSGEIEKIHDWTIKPKTREECENIDEFLEQMEFADEVDTEEYRLTKQVQRVCRMAEKLKMNTLASLMFKQEFPERFLGKIVNHIEDFETLRNGKSFATDKQKAFCVSLGMDQNVADKINRNEAALFIESIKGKRKVVNDGGVLKAGKFAGKHVNQLPWAYVSMVLKRFPNSPVAKQIREYRQKASPA